MRQSVLLRLFLLMLTSNFAMAEEVAISPAEALLWLREGLPRDDAALVTRGCPAVFVPVIRWELYENCVEIAAEAGSSDAILLLTERSSKPLPAPLLEDLTLGIAVRAQRRNSWEDWDRNVSINTERFQNACSAALLRMNSKNESRDELEPAIAEEPEVPPMETLRDYLAVAGEMLGEIIIDYAPPGMEAAHAWLREQGAKHGADLRQIALDSAEAPDVRKAAGYFYVLTGGPPALEWAQQQLTQMEIPEEKRVDINVDLPDEELERLFQQAAIQEFPEDLVDVLFSALKETSPARARETARACVVATADATPAALYYLLPSHGLRDPTGTARHPEDAALVLEHYETLANKFPCPQLFYPFLVPSIR